MRKVQFIYRLGIMALVCGIVAVILGLFKEQRLIERIMAKVIEGERSVNYMFVMIAGLLACLAGIFMISYYTAQSRTWICTECYMRFETGIYDIIQGRITGRNRRKLYCRKCRKKTVCKGKKLVMNIHYF